MLTHAHAHTHTHTHTLTHTHTHTHTHTDSSRLTPTCLPRGVQELILPLLLLGLLILISTLNPHVYYGGISTMVLEKEDDSHIISVLGYTPITNVTNHIMEEVAQEMRK